MGFVLALERFVDDSVDGAVSFVRRQRVAVGVLLCVLLFVFRGAVAQFVRSQMTQISAVLATGISAHQVAAGAAVGLVSGLGPPGLTLALALPLVLREASVLGIVCDAPAVALAVACNAVLTVPDLIVWQTVFAKLGSKLLPGGKHIRPFLAGGVPYLLASPLMLLAAHLSFSTIAKTLLN